MIVRGCQSYFRQLGLAGCAMVGGQSSQNAIRKPSTTSKFQNTRAPKITFTTLASNLTIDIVNRLQDVELR